MNTWQRLKNNPKLWEQYFIRERTFKAIRAFFYELQFHEVETPILIAHPAAESYLDVFHTTLLDRNRNPIQTYLSTSPELAIKKLLVAGIGNCYSITKSFRNTETNSHTHAPEFSILEWYRVEMSYESIMDDCENLVRTVHKAIHGTQTLTYQEKSYDLNKPWKRISMKEAFSQYAHIDLDTFFNMNKAKQIATER
jgi:lysyl-tRNA synthetase class 2